MHYEEHPAPDALRPWLQCIWQLRWDAPAGAVQTLYPDGRCELILHRGTPPGLREAGGAWQPQGRLLFAAQTRRALQLRAQGPLHCIGLRLQPAASGALWPGALGAQRLGAWQHRVVDLTAHEPSWPAALQQVLAQAEPFPPAALVDWAAQRLCGAQPDALAQAACQALDAADGNLSVTALARQLGCGLRSLQQRFGSAVGLAPKEYARIRRLQACIRLLDAGDVAPADAAFSSGFADQAHATRALRDFAGLPPARLRRALRDQREGDTSLALAAAFVRGQAL